MIEESKSGAVGENREGSTARTEAPASDPRIQSKIIGGVEWYMVDAGPMEQDLFEDCQCARCGSSVSFRRCWNCDHGYVEEDIGDDACEELIDVRCGICRGRGGWYCCLSTPEYCETHPIPGRESILSTAVESAAWDDD